MIHIMNKQKLYERKYIHCLFLHKAFVYSAVILFYCLIYYVKCLLNFSSRCTCRIFDKYCKHFFLISSFLYSDIVCNRIANLALPKKCTGHTLFSGQASELNRLGRVLTSVDISLFSNNARL